MNQPHTTFDLAFWHPFGAHAKETTLKIINRKTAEIETNGWTLWSFQHRRPSTLKHWYQLLTGASNDVIVFCSDSPNAADPTGDGTSEPPPSCSHYTLIDSQTPLPMSEAIKVPHPFRPGRKLIASAFVVKQIIYPVAQLDQPVEWYKFKSDDWQQARVPTRGEYLIRPGGAIQMRPISAVLILKPPYLAEVTIDDGNAATQNL